MYSYLYIMIRVPRMSCRHPPRQYSLREASESQCEAQFRSGSSNPIEHVPPTLLASLACSFHTILDESGAAFLSEWLLPGPKIWLWEPKASKIDPKMIIKWDMEPLFFWMCETLILKDPPMVLHDFQRSKRPGIHAKSQRNQTCKSHAKKVI